LLDTSTAHAERTIKVDGRMEEIFVLQDRLVRELADLLRGVIRLTGAAPLETGVVGAYEAFSKGVLNLRTETYESLDRAVMLFEQAVDLDPGYARAHLELRRRVRDQGRLSGKGRAAHPGGKEPPSCARTAARLGARVA
jgi:hypothetical protein